MFNFSPTPGQRISPTPQSASQPPSSAPHQQQTAPASVYESRKLPPKQRQLSQLSLNSKKINHQSSPHPEFRDFLTGKYKRRASSGDVGSFGTGVSVNNFGMGISVMSGMVNGMVDDNNSGNNGNSGNGGSFKNIRTPQSPHNNTLSHITQQASSSQKRTKDVEDVEYEDVEYAKFIRSKRREWYKRSFEFWVPKQLKIENYDEDSDSDDENEVAVQRRKEKEDHDTSTVIPVEEVLDRLVIKSIRLRAARRFVLFLLFVFFYYMSLIYQRSLSDSFSLESSIKRRFLTVTSPNSDITYADISDLDELWEWLEGGFLQLVFPDEKWYNGDRIDGADEAEGGYVFLYNKPVGNFRLLQKRVVVSSGCDLAAEFCNEYPYVWTDLLGSETSTAVKGKTSHVPFGPKHDVEKYAYTADQNGSGEGFFVDFPLLKSLAKFKLAELKKDRWIDKQTRSIEAVYTVYNGNLRLFAVTRFQINLNAAGMITTSLSLGSLRLSDASLATDYFQFVLEAGALLLAIVHTLTEFREFRNFGAGYFVFWNNIDILRQILFYYSVIRYIELVEHPLRKNLTLPVPDDKYIGFEELVSLETDYVMIHMINLLLTTLMIFKFLVPFPKLGVFVHTMTKAGKDLMSFMLLLCLILVGFVLIGHIQFGHVLEDYSTIGKAFSSVSYLALGEFDFPSLVEASSFEIAAIYFYTFVIIVPIITLNMVIAIIFSAYDSLNEQIAEIQDVPIFRDIVLNIFLFRDPSMRELSNPNIAFAVIQAYHNLFSSLFSCTFFRNIKEQYDAARVEKDNDKTAETFTESDLLILLDADFSYRLTGGVSASVSDSVRLAKSTVTEILKAKGKAKKSSSNNAKSLNLDEFCCLIHKVDEGNDGVNIGSISEGDMSFTRDRAYNYDEQNSDQYKISQLVFQLYSKKLEQDDQKNFRSYVRKTLKRQQKDVFAITKRFDEVIGAATRAGEQGKVFKQSSTGYRQFDKGTKREFNYKFKNAVKTVVQKERASTGSFEGTAGLMGFIEENVLPAIKEREKDKEIVYEVEGEGTGNENEI